MSNTLLPWTKVVLGVSALVQLLFGLLAVIAPSWLVSSFLALVPNPGGPMIIIQYFGALYIANGLGAAYALRQNKWSDARTYLAISGPYVTLSLLLTIYALVTPPGLSTIAWAYTALAVAYLPLVYFIWRQESARGMAS